MVLDSARGLPVENLWDLWKCRKTCGNLPFLDQNLWITGRGMLLTRQNRRNSLSRMAQRRKKPKRRSIIVHPVGLALFRYRAARRLDLRTVAEAIGVAAETLRRLETGAPSYPITVESVRQYLEKKKVKIAA